MADRTELGGRTEQGGRGELFTRTELNALLVPLGPELITSFVNGSTVPLDTLVTSGVDISSGIATVGNTGCVANPAFAVLTGDKFVLEIDTVTINSFSDGGLRILIAAGASGNTAARSDTIFVSSNSTGFKHTFTTISDDAGSFLQLGSGPPVAAVDFALAGVSLKKVL